MHLENKGETVDQSIFLSGQGGCRGPSGNRQIGFQDYVSVRQLNINRPHAMYSGHLFFYGFSRLCTRRQLCNTQVTHLVFFK